MTPDSVGPEPFQSGAAFAEPSGDGQDGLWSGCALVSECSLTAAAELRVSIMDVDRAVELYVAGWTQRRIGAELGVDHRRVAVRLHRAGVTLRRGGAPRYEVDTQRILDLRDQGLTMTAVAAEVGMSVPGGLGPVLPGSSNEAG